MKEPAVTQLGNERSRTVVEGRRTDDGDQCKLVVVHEVTGGCVALYPHGAKQFGVRLTKADAVTVAQAILAGAVVSDPDLYEWLALRRVHDGGVAKSAGAYLDHGRPTPGYLTDVFDRLIWTRLVTVSDGDALWELRRLSLTDTGQARYTALSEQRRSDLVVPPPEFGTT